MSKAQIVVAMLFIVLQSVTVALLVNNDRADEELRHLRERVALLEESLRVTKELQVKSEQVCTYQDAMGQVCRAAFMDLVGRLGLDTKDGGTAQAVLRAFDGLGGP